jgi:hypothetical protein
MHWLSSLAEANGRSPKAALPKNTKQRSNPKGSNTLFML